MKAAPANSQTAWEALEAEYARQFPDREGSDLAQRIQAGFAAAADLDLSIALRTIAPEGATPPPPATGPDRTAYIQWIIDRLCTVSMEDGLTGLFNRRYFDHRLRQELHRATRDRRPLSVMIIDADHFKQVNDKYGHVAGDQVLQILGQIMLDALRTTDDVTTRFGGEEFAIILPGTDARGAATAAERLRASVEDHSFETEQHQLRLTVSAGIATFDPGWAPTAPRELIEQADAALYQAKASGRNRVVAHGQSPALPAGGVTRAEKDALLK